LDEQNSRKMTNRVFSSEMFRIRLYLVALLIATSSVISLPIPQSIGMEGDEQSSANLPISAISQANFTTPNMTASIMGGEPQSQLGAGPDYRTLSVDDPPANLTTLADSESGIGDNPDVDEMTRSGLSGSAASQNNTAKPNNSNPIGGGPELSKLVGDDSAGSDGNATEAGLTGGERLFKSNDTMTTESTSSGQEQSGQSTSVGSGTNANVDRNKELDKCNSDDRVCQDNCAKGSDQACFQDCHAKLAACQAKNA
jgi:hypothetical protein